MCYPIYVRQSRALRDHPHLTIGTLLDPVSGKFVSRRNGSVKR